MSMRRLKLCYLKSSSITQLFLDVFIYNIFKYVSSILNIITVTVSKIVQKHLGNIITGLSRNKNATRVNSEVLQVAISPKFKARDRIMKIKWDWLIIWKKSTRFFLYAFIGGMVTVMNAAGQPIQLPAATIQAAQAQNGIGNFFLLTS